MPPKVKKQKKPKESKFIKDVKKKEKKIKPVQRPRKRKQPLVKCDRIEGDRFYAHTEDLFGYSWWEVCCFPYILCSRFFDCCMSICAGTNQCMVYWMLVQWCVCKITRVTTPDPIIFPYYFYMFCQVILLTAFFVLLWHFVGKSIIIPYLKAIYEAMAANFRQNPNDILNANKTKFADMSVGIFQDDINKQKNQVKEWDLRRKLKFRKYCFRKSELFEIAEPGAANSLVGDYFVTFASVLLEVFVDQFVLRQ